MGDLVLVTGPDATRSSRPCSPGPRPARRRRRAPPPAAVRKASRRGAFRLLPWRRVGADTDPGGGPASAGSAAVQDPRRPTPGASTGDQVSLVGPRARGVVPANGPTSARRRGRRVPVGPSRRRRRGDPAMPSAGVRLRGLAGGVHESLAYRIEAGIPLPGSTSTDVDDPQEAELETDAVSFTKGCFLGQELVCRIDSRGHVNLSCAGWCPSTAGTGPARRSSRGAKVVGVITGVTPDGVPPVALGYVRRGLEPGAVVEVRWDAGSTGAGSSRAARVPRPRHGGSHGHQDFHGRRDVTGGPRRGRMSRRTGVPRCAVCVFAPEPAPHHRRSRPNDRRAARGASRTAGRRRSSCRAPRSRRSRTSTGAGTKWSHRTWRVIEPAVR